MELQPGIPVYLLTYITNLGLFAGGSSSEYYTAHDIYTLDARTLLMQRSYSVYPSDKLVHADS
jgi:hypothetical protein